MSDSNKGGSSSSILIVFVVILFMCFMCCVLVIVGMFFLAREVEDEVNDVQLQLEEDIEEMEELEDDLNEINNTLKNPLESEETPELETGIITGYIGFPSEYVPKQEVCAETLKGLVVSCVEIEASDKNTNYELIVPEGTYYVFATTLGEPTTYGIEAYFSDFVTCGQSVDCTSHDPIPVKVQVGQTVEDVNPVDWYNF